MNVLKHTTRPTRVLFSIFILAIIAGLSGCDSVTGPSLQNDLSSVRMLRGHGDEIGSLDGSAAAQPTDLGDYRRVAAVHNVSFERSAGR